MQNIYTYLKKIDFEKRIKKRCDMFKKAGIDKDITSCEVMTQFCFGLMQDMYSKIYDDFVKEKQR